MNSKPFNQQIVEPMDDAIRALSASEALTRLPDLISILVDCVEGGASVSYLAPLAPAKAWAFWQQVVNGVATGERALLVAEDPDGRVVGTVQVVLDQPENQPHRADISKLLVDPAARRRGLGVGLMTSAEDAARAAGKTLLVLDTATGSDAERLYERSGWTRAGVIPGYSLLPDGRPWGTTYFYKQLA